MLSEQVVGIENDLQKFRRTEPRQQSTSVSIVRRGAQQLATAFSDFQRMHTTCPQSSSSTLKREGVANGYCLVLRGCRVRVPQALSVPGAIPRGGGIALRFRVSLFDCSSGSFFGRTYTSVRACALTDRGNGLVENEDPEVLYLVSSIKDNNAATVVEAVLVVHDVAGVTLQVCIAEQFRECPFLRLRPFLCLRTTPVL